MSADTTIGVHFFDWDGARGAHTHLINNGVRMRIDSAVPSSRAIPFSMNQGRPIVVEDPKSQAARELTTFTQRFVDHGSSETGPEARSGFLRRRRDR